MINDGFNYIFVGEGEKTFSEIVDQLINKKYPKTIIREKLIIRKVLAL